MIRKLNVNEAYENFDENELYFYIKDSIEDAIEMLESNELDLFEMENRVPGYNSDWHSYDIDDNHEEMKDSLIDKLTDCYMDLFLANYKKK